jgi:hypothetical protein
MDVMIVEEQPAAQAALVAALATPGRRVVCFGNLEGAEALVRLSTPDVLIVGEQVGGRLSHGLALLAECRNPGLIVIMRTERPAESQDDLVELIPSLWAVLGTTVAPSGIAALVANYLGQQDVPIRISDEGALPRMPARVPGAELVAQDDRPLSMAAVAGNDSAETAPPHDVKDLAPPDPQPVAADHVFGSAADATASRLLPEGRIADLAAWQAVAGSLFGDAVGPAASGPAAVGPAAVGLAARAGLDLAHATSAPRVDLHPGAGLAALLRRRYSGSLPQDEQPVQARTGTGRRLTLG